MTIFNQLLQFYLLFCKRIQQSFFVIILQASALVIHSAVPFVLCSFQVETTPAFYGVDRLIGLYHRTGIY